jgi:putative membrane-bound dehydrogenase-like protein
MKLKYLGVLIIAISFACSTQKVNEKESGQEDVILLIKQSEDAESIMVYRSGTDAPILTQNVKEDFRPYLHPIIAPDGNGTLTEFSPGHHKHQTGLYWGLTRVNGRDFFHNPQGDYWRKSSAEILVQEGPEVKWKTVYNMLDGKGEVIMKEIQIWAMSERDGKFFLDLEWRGETQEDITISKYDYGGLFLRMPWKEGIKAEVNNAARQKNERAEGERAMWIDVAMQLEGRNDMAHIAIFDHPKNGGYPQPWRVDGQFGIGPARTRLGDWKIEKGNTEVIKHQMVVYSGEFNETVLNELWGEFSGSKGTYSTAALWVLARKEGRDAKFLTPEEAVEAMTIKQGFKVNVFASEPMITQPMAFCWDDKGRLWIAENRDYESRAHGFSNSGDSRILILEDTNGDGVADSRKVFIEGIAFPAAIAVGFDGVFVGAPPNLLFIPDKNNDDKADVDEIEIKLTGWGIRDRHETINSLHWGPDGWLYGLQGYATPSKVRKPRGGEKIIYKKNDNFPEDLLEADGVDINGGVWRYHPTKDVFEVVAHGFSNPWGIDHDAKGQLFMTACVIPHLWHIVQGGVYHRQGGQHFNPYLYSDIRTITNHSHRSAHGGARIYLSDAFPEEERGRLFMANIHEHAVLSDILERKGSGFVGHHADDFMMANNAQWVGFSMEIGPEGGLYVLDWHDADICGQEVLNFETGRVFRIMPVKSLAENWEGRYADLGRLPDKGLVDLLSSKSEWHARRAQLVLQVRSSKGILKKDTHEQLRNLFTKTTNADHRMRALWALHVTKGWKDSELVKLLSDKDEYVRAWAIQFLCEDYTPSREALVKFEKMAKEDPSPVVRLYLSSAIQRMPVDAKWNIIEGLVMHSKDVEDHNLPKMIWYGLEPLVASNPERALSIASKSEIPLITRYTARRTVDADALETLVSWIGKKSKTQIHLLEGMMEGVEGRLDLTTPSKWNIVYNKLQKEDKKVAQIAMEIAQEFGDTEAAKKSLATLKDKNEPAPQRKKALQTLARQQRADLIGILPDLLKDKDLKIDAIRAIAEFENQELGTLLLEQYNSFNSAERHEVVQTLSSRPRYGWMLTQAIAKGSIPRKDIPAYAARQLRRVVGSGFVEVWGPIDEVPAHENEAYAKYRALLTDKAVSLADPVKGRVLFRQTCGGCHKMYGEGGTLGPDITGSNRANVDYLLVNVLNPSEEVQDDYKMVTITTRDGRTYSGNIIAENDRQVTMRMVGQDAVVINKSTIQSKEVSEVSMMPPGLFDTLSDKEVLDLVAYLRTVEQAK